MGNKCSWGHVDLLNEFRRRFSEDKVDKILTIKTSGIGIAVIAAITLKLL